MTFLKNSFIYILGEIISKIAPFLLFPYLTRKMGVAGFGELSYYQFFLSMLSLFIGLALDSGIARYYYFYGKNALSVIVVVANTYVILLGLFALIFSWYFKSSIFFIITLTAISLNLVGIQLSIRQFQKQALIYVVYQFLIAALIPLSTIALFECFGENYIELRYLAMFLVNIIVWFIASILFFKKNTLHIKGKFKAIILTFTYLFNYGMPLLLHQVSGLLKGQADRFVIYNQFTKTDLGLYSAGWQLAVPLSIAITAVNKAALPIIFENLKTKKYTIEFFKKIFFCSLIFVVVSFIVLGILPEKILLWMLGQDFVGVKYYFLCFIVASGLLAPYLVLVNILLFYNKTKLVSLCSFLSLVLYIVFLLAFSRLSNIDLMPFATIISNMFLLPLLYYFVNKIECSRRVIN
ncbi:oligosaccharide flippase family protein [Acinetobacter sp. ANC 5584]